MQNNSMPNNLADWLKYIDTISFTKIDLGLERITAVAAKLDLLKPDAFVVTVAGTNGKGSTCAYLGSILQACDLRVGIYSSPHLFKFNERISINGMWASDDELCEAFTAIEEVRSELNITLTYFEFSTLAALWLFSSTKLDVIILEVGLGGRLDAVNIIDANLAIITSIGLDHTEWLGNTHAQIVSEKLGIVRPNIPIIYGDVNPPQIVLDTIGGDSNFYLSSRDYQFKLNTKDRSKFNYVSENYKFDNLPNPGLLSSAASAVCAATIICPDIEQEFISDGLQVAYIPGRLELHKAYIKGKLLYVIFDVAHNPPAVQFLANNLQELNILTPNNKLYAVFSILNDKDLPAMLEVMPKIESFAISELGCDRTQKIEVIKHNLQQVKANFSEHQNIADALHYQINQADDNDVIVIFGSFYVVSEAKQAFKQLQVK